MFRCLSFFVHKKGNGLPCSRLLALSLSLSLGPIFVTSGLLLAELLFVNELFFLFRFTAHPGVTDRSTGTASSGRASRSRGFLHRCATLFVGGGSGTERTEEEKTQSNEMKYKCNVNINVNKTNKRNDLRGLRSFGFDGQFTDSLVGVFRRFLRGLFQHGCFWF